LNPEQWPIDGGIDSWNGLSIIIELFWKVDVSFYLLKQFSVLNDENVIWCPREDFACAFRACRPCFAAADENA